MNEPQGGRGSLLIYGEQSVNPLHSIKQTNRINVTVELLSLFSCHDWIHFDCSFFPELKYFAQMALHRPIVKAGLTSSNKSVNMSLNLKRKNKCLNSICMKHKPRGFFTKTCFNSLKLWHDVFSHLSFISGNHRGLLNKGPLCEWLHISRSCESTITSCYPGSQEEIRALLQEWCNNKGRMPNIPYPEVPWSWVSSSRYDTPKHQVIQASNIAKDNQRHFRKTSAFFGPDEIPIAVAL